MEFRFHTREQRRLSVWIVARLDAQPLPLRIRLQFLLR